MMNSVMGMNMRQMSSLQSSMQAMLTADSALNKAQVQESVVNRLNGRANVLESEISGGNGNIEAKEEELDKVRQSALDATVAQGEMLSQAQDAMESIADTDTYEAGSASSLPKAEEITKDAAAGEDPEKDGEGAASLAPENTGENVYTGDGKTLVQKAAPVVSVVA